MIFGYVENLRNKIQICDSEKEDGLSCGTHSAVLCNTVLKFCKVHFAANLSMSLEKNHT